MTVPLLKWPVDKQIKVLLELVTVPLKLFISF